MNRDGHKKPRRINCRTCAHHYVTWDRRFPRGCKAFGFKTKNMPCLDVFASSGFDCQQYERKKPNLS